jgi:hypothetical protein
MTSESDDRENRLHREGVTAPRRRHSRMDSEIGKCFLARNQAADLKWACDETLASLVSPVHVRVAFMACLVQMPDGGKWQK